MKEKALDNIQYPFHVKKHKAKLWAKEEMKGTLSAKKDSAQEHTYNTLQGETKYIVSKIECSDRSTDNTI